MDEKMKNKVVCIFIGTMFLLGFLCCVMLSKPTIIESERRKAAMFPSLTWNSISNGSFMREFQMYTTDTFPFREQLRKIKTNSLFTLFRRSDYNGLYITDGFISKMDYPLHEQALWKAMERFRYIYEKYANENNSVYVSVIFEKNSVTAKTSGHLSIDEDVFEQIVKEKMDFANYISIRDLLDKEDFYQTDTHWRQENIVDVAERLAASMGADIQSSYITHLLQRPFFGVCKGQIALDLPSESMYYLRNEIIDHCVVYDWQNDKTMDVYNMEKAKGNDPYEMFLSGNLPLITMKNNKADTDKKLILFRDSFGSSIAPLLIEGYAEITLVDIRLIHPDQVGRYISFEGSDLLFLYSSYVLNHSETLK